MEENKGAIIGIIFVMFIIFGTWALVAFNL